MALNLRAPFLTAKAFAGGMKRRRWGRIVNIASGAGRSYSRSRVIPYAAAKAGLLGFTRQLAVDLAPYGVNVNAVSPGIIETPGMKEANWGGVPSPKQLREVNRSIPLGRLGYSREVAEAIVWLSLESSSYITGTILPVAGGR